MRPLSRLTRYSPAWLGISTDEAANNQPVIDRRFTQFALEIAKAIRLDAVAAGLAIQPEPIRPVDDRVEKYDSLVTSNQLRQATRKLFIDGHYARAVEEAYKCLNNAVKDKSGLNSKDGADLMREAFSAHDPKLKLNDLRSQSQKDEQRGYMDIYAGAMTGIRNPRAHDHRLDDQPDVALELLATANHLMRRLDGAKRARHRKKVP